MKAIFTLLNSYFWKTFYGPIISFVFPVIILSIMGNIFKIEYVYPGIIALSFLFIGLLSLPLSVIELKQSSIFKYIGSTSINPIKLTFIIILYYIFIAFITIFIILLSTIFIFYKDVFPSPEIGDNESLPTWEFKWILNGIFSGIFTFVGFSSFFISIFIHLFFVIVIGLIIATFSKTPQQALTIGLIICIPSMFLSGMIVSVDVISRSFTLNWISRFMPFRYSTGNMIIAATPNDQIGDIFEKLSVIQKKQIFDNWIVQENGNLNIIISSQEIEEIKNMNDLKIFAHNQGNNIYNFVNDKALYDLIFGNIVSSDIKASDNNIFKLTNSWSVRRIPDTEEVRKFIVEYFSSFAEKDGEAGADFKNLLPIATQIINGEFDWLDIFLKQNKVFFTRIDRILNLFFPFWFSCIGIWIISLNFKWSDKF